ncbi:MAG: DUF1549 and DUF1553 domain-containing protein [Gemmataceae bacterium]|nr:DUF1549 and DUF1553 domain-containing protein [Gemmataceae bacterium]MDW8264594.1 DUF1549 and DUF1553 domain-containing protein [Gemmataceae bacterium]
MPRDSSLPRFVRASWPALGCVLLASLGPAARAEPGPFQHEVMAVLSRAGCNQGVCHGNQNGKNGFKLSLRGEDPEADWRALTRDALGRRIDLSQPANSLLLLKATAAVPHEGGRRFGVGSPEHQVLVRWLAAGAPADPPGGPRLVGLTVTPAAQVLLEPADRMLLRAEAQFSDGSRRDATGLAVFEPSNGAVAVAGPGEVLRRADLANGPVETTVVVRYLDQQAAVPLAFVPRRPEFAWPDVPEVNFIDTHVFAKLRTLRVAPSGLAPDHVFLRRVFLDVLGILPTAEEARAFLADPRLDKRGRLIDALLERPEFADWWALKWADLLRNEEKTLDRKGVQAFHRWIRERIADHTPLNEFARQLIAGVGSTYSRPQANLYRALRDPAVRAETVAQVFLGIRIQCARCHNHPFDRWTQRDYHSLAAFFARVQYRIVENNRLDQLDAHEFDGEQIVWQDRVGEVRHPRTGEVLRPKFLGGPELDPSHDKDRLGALADWVADPGNPFFARAQVNRVWLHLMGRGLVEPNDDFRLSNPPVNGPLLEALTRDFVAHHFDLRHLVRTILRSSTYQLDSRPNETNRDNESHFARAVVRPLPAEALLDAVAQVCERPVAFNGYPLGLRAGQLPGVRAFRDRERRPSSGERFLTIFGKPDRLLSCECERSEDTTLARAFQFITGEVVHDLLSAPNNRLGRLLASGKEDAAILDELYLASLARRPSDAEQTATLALVRASSDRRAAWEDVLWGLINSKEFLLRR